MNRWSSLMLAGLMLGTPIVPPSVAQETSVRRIAAETDGPEGYGLLLTPAVMDKLLDRIVEKMSQDLKFDEAQSSDAQRIFKENILRFAKENQNELTKLANEFLEKRLGVEAPSAEEVADWAKRAQPMLEKTQALVTHVSEEMRGFMTDEQQIKMDASLAAFEVGSNFVGRRLASWSEGGFDPATEWHRNPGVQQLDQENARRLEFAMEQARRSKLGQAPPEAAEAAEAQLVVPVTSTPEAAAAAANAAQPTHVTKADTKAEPKDEWTKYVEAFISRYNLDSTQAQKAMVFLNTASQKRDVYLRGRGKQMEQTEKSFKSAGTPESVKAAEEQYQALMQPVDRMFEKLKENLDSLPTREQRRKASDNAPAKDEAAKKSAPAPKP
jgi:hypothetical protein